MNAAQQVVVEKLVALLGESCVQWDAVSPAQRTSIMAALDPACQNWEIGSETGPNPPVAIAYPETTEALSNLMALAHEHKWKVMAMGQGSKISWGGLADEVDVVVSSAKLNRIVEHAVGDFTVTVEPGIKFADLRSHLAAEGQMLAIDPAFSEHASIGGIVATADAGSLRQRYGGLRDMLIGVQFVRHDGELARAGGRVVKNVAGYDLMKLMTGAYGSLGILSELTFRLYPINQVSRTLILSGGEMALEAAISEVRMSGLTPIALDLTLARQTAAMTASEENGHMSLVARFQGIADGVDEQTERLKKIATTHSMQIQQLDGEADQAYWQKASELITADTLFCKVGMRPSALPAMLAMIENDSIHSAAQVMLHGSSGLGWVQWPAAIADKTEIVSALEKMRSHCQNNGGFLTLLQAPQSLKQTLDIWGYNGNALNVMRDIKQKFDPNRCLSPGRFVGGL